MVLADLQLQKPYLEETHAEFIESLDTYVGGAMAFSKEVVRMLFDQHGPTLLADGGGKKGTLIFTGTLGAMRTNANFAAYGASRSGARSLAQALAREYSPSKFACWTDTGCYVPRINSHEKPRKLYPRDVSFCLIKRLNKEKAYSENPRWYTCRTCYCQRVSVWLITVYGDFRREMCSQ